jgi:hypothetical protein
MKKNKIKLLAALAVVLVAGAGLAAPMDVNYTVANSSYLTFPSTSIKVANGDSIAVVTNTCMLISNDGGSTTTTNTIGSASNSFLLAILKVKAGQTNSTLIANSGNVHIGADWNGTAEGNPLLLMSYGTNWYGDCLDAMAGNVTIAGTLGVAGVATFASTPVVGSITIATNANIAGNLNVNGTSVIGDTLTDPVTIGGTLTVTGMVRTVGSVTLGDTATDNLINSGTATFSNATTFVTAPVVTASTNGCLLGTVAGTLTNLPTGICTDPKYFVVNLGTNSLAVPGFPIPTHIP